MSTVTVTPTKPSLYSGVEVEYNGQSVTIKYRFETSEGVEPRILSLEAVNTDCILRFTDPSEVGLDFLFLKAGQVKTIPLPKRDGPPPIRYWGSIWFEVFSLAKARNASEPPPIK